MKKISYVLISLLCFAGASAETVEPDSPGGFTRADFRSEIEVGKLRKLLGVQAGMLFVGKQDGSIGVLDKDGKQLMQLATKQGSIELLKRPESVAVHRDTIYVVDSGTDQVVMYEKSSGKYLARFGSKAAGLGRQAALDEPKGIAVHEGVVYVADTGNERIQLFGSNGVFLMTLPLIAEAGKADKDAPHLLREPTDIGVDGKGRIYVLDAKVPMVKVYGQNGQYLRTLADTGEAVALSVAEDGIYVADSAGFSILKYDFAGTQLYGFGSKGEGKAQFKEITGLAVDAAQQVYVGDAKKSLVNAFVAEASKAIERLPKEAGRTSVKWVGSMGIEVDQLAWNGKDAFHAVSKDKKTIFEIREGAIATQIKLEDMQIAALTVDKNGALWVLDRKGHRGAKLDENGNVLVTFGSSGSGAGQFGDPSAIAVSANGMVFVADRSNDNVQIFRNDGVYLSKLNGEAAKLMKEPVALAFDANDNLYILDRSRASIFAYTAKGQSAGEIGRTPEGASLLEKPIDLVASNGELFVLEADVVKVLSSTGQLLRTFGASGSAEGAFDEPVAMCAGGGVDVLISDRGNKRIQRLATVYKPQAPQGLNAQSKVHAVELRWDQTDASYIKQYRIYRSASEKGKFVPIGTSTTNQYLDPDLDAGARYFYRVSAETHFDFEGATSVAVSEIPAKYVPPAMTVSPQVETTPWQVKMNWSPIDSKYFAAFRIYQKEGEVYAMIGETTLPEFVKDALQPETHYTYYLTVVSTDGTESEKLAVEATTQIFNRPPLEIEVVQLQDVFANSYKLYERSGIGKIKLTNNTNKSMQRLSISFQLKDFMDFPTETRLDKLLPGQSEEVVLKAVFNNSILTMTEDSTVQAMIEASYFESGKRVTYNKVPTVSVYDKHRLTWDERDRFATFVTPKDTPIVNLVRAAVTQFKETKDEIQLAAAVFDMLGVYGMTYIQDPSNPYQITSGKAHTVDYIQFPRETLERKSGDCDDLVAFYSAALESMGITTRVLEVPGHMLMMFATGIEADEDGYTMDHMFVIHEGQLWVPVETTLMGSAFIKAWEKGAATYYKWQGKGLTLLDVHSAWETYKPASLPAANTKALEITRAEIEKKFPGDYMSVLKISSQTQTRRYLTAIKDNPADMDAHLQMGIILARAGDRKEAMKYFDKVLEKEPKNAAALNNRGNLLLIGDMHAEAQKAYLAALQASPKDAQIWVNLARSYKASGLGKKAKEAFSKAVKLDPSIKETNRALALELLNAL